MLNRGLNLQPDRSRRPLALALVSVAAIGFGLVGAFAVFVAGALLGVLLLSAPFINSVFEDLPDVGAVADFSDQLFESTVVYSADGVELGELIDEGRRTLLAPDQIPQLIKDAVVASEDASFYDNPGFDLRAVVRAAWLNLRAQDIVSGFSTITQQVVKNSLLSPEQTLERKLREVVLAYRLSQGLAKDEILALYLNQNNYGNLAYGIVAAADTYFGKSVDDLSLAEAAMLVGIPRAPTALNPFADLASATRVQHNVLDLMERNRFVTADDVRRAKAETLVFAPPDPDFGPAPHFFRYVAEYLQERYGPDVATQGWRVRTTLRLDVQREVEAAVREHIATLLAGGHNAHNAAVVVLDPRTGDILMMIGSADFGNEEIDGQVNMALAPRQPGSAFKPFTYATLLEQGQTPATLFYDVPVSIPQFGDQEPYEPGNYDLRFRGPVLMRFALANSLNIPAVKAQQLAGVEATLDTARALGLTVAGGPADYGPALALGSAGVPLLDLASAYGAFGQGRAVPSAEPDPGNCRQPRHRSLRAAAPGTATGCRRTGRLSDNRHPLGRRSAPGGIRAEPKHARYRAPGRGQDRDHQRLSRCRHRRLFDPDRRRGLGGQCRQHADDRRPRIARGVAHLARGHGNRPCPAGPRAGALRAPARAGRG